MAMPPCAATITACELPHPPKVAQAPLESERDAAWTAALATARAIDGMFDPRRVRDRDPHDQPYRQFRERPDEFREALERAVECMAYSRSDSGLPSRREWKDCNRSLCLRIVRDHIPALIRALERAGCDADDARKLTIARTEWKPLLTGLVEFWCAPSAREPNWTEGLVRRTWRALAELRARLGPRRTELNGFATWFVRELAAAPEDRARPSSTPTSPYVAEDFATIVAGDCEFHFRTPKQREIIRLLHEAWKAAGCRDGCGLTLARLQEGLAVTVERLRVERTLKDTGAIGTLVRSTAKGTWALYLKSPLTSDAPKKPRESPR